MDSGFILALVSVSAIGLICAVMLAVASKIMAVDVDKRVAQILGILPGVGCGACGFTGCERYANALVHEEAETNLCTPGGSAVSKKISEILGVAVEDVLQQVAAVYCRGDSTARIQKMDYQGLQSCKASKLFFGGLNACIFGCLGFGDCAKACPHGAICIEDGLAHIDTRKCTGCRLCIRACPNNVIFMEYSAATPAVLCKNTEKGAAVKKKCSSGCIACMKCARECPAGAITPGDNLAKIDQSKCTGCGKCAEVCITKCVRQPGAGGISLAKHKIHAR